MKIRLSDYPPIYPTQTIRRKAFAEKPQREGGKYWAGIKYKTPFYLRAKEHSGILHIALFLVESVRYGVKTPNYEIFIDTVKRDFTTYDRAHNRWSTAMIDNLDMPSYMYWSGWSNVYADRECERLLKTHLKQEKSGWLAIRDYQRSIREDQLLKRHRKETDPWDAVMVKVGDVPKDWQRWVNKVGLPEKFIIYKYAGGKPAKGWCTHCEREVEVKAKHNTYGTCPHCRSKVIFKAVGKLPTHLDTDRHWLYLLQRYGEGFVVRQFLASRRYAKDNYRSPYISISEERRLVCPAGETPTTYYYGLYKQRFMRWICTGQLNEGRFYYTSDYLGKVYTRNLSGLTERLARTGLIEMIRYSDKCDPETYYAMYRKHPIVEQLAKSKLTALVIDQCGGRYGCWHDNDILNLTCIGDLAKTLKIDKSRLARLRAMNGDTRHLHWLRYEKAAGKSIPDDVISWLATERIEQQDIQFISDRMSEVQIKNYLSRQKAETGQKVRDIIDTWKDYLAMATRLKMNTADEIVYKVKKLYQRHDELVKVIEENHMSIRAGEILERLPNIEEVLVSISDKYAYNNDEYTIMAPQSIEDILNEGQALSHCIDKNDRYFERIASRESYLLFLRRTIEPDKPWYTLEVEPDGTIRQKRTEFDRQNPDLKKAEPFLKRWQKEIQKRLTADDKQLAADSHDKRVRDLEEMRRNDVRIHGGEFAGQLLADVLEADLMELAI